MATREQIYRQQLKALRKLRGAADPPVPEDLIATRLQAIADRVGAYTVPKIPEAGDE